MIDTFTGDFNFLSNFYKTDTDKYTLEHLYQAAKTLDKNWRAVILDAPTPGRAKKYGRICPIKSNWNKIKLDIMEGLVRDKFKDIKMVLKLTDTFPEKLVEGNIWHDNFWGDCKCDRCKNIIGKNNLGRILMKIRKEKLPKLLENVLYILEM